jgi:hypothetical protein
MESSILKNKKINETALILALTIFTSDNSEVKWRWVNFNTAPPGTKFEEYNLKLSYNLVNVHSFC